MPSAVLGAGMRGTDQVHGRGYCPGRGGSQCGDMESAEPCGNYELCQVYRNMGKVGVSGHAVGVEGEHLVRGQVGPLWSYLGI